MSTQSHRVTCALAYMARTGCKPAAAAARYKVSPSSIRRAMRRAGLPVARPGRPFKTHPESTPCAT